MPTLHWIGKDKVVNHHQDVPFRVLEHKYGFTAENGNQEEPTNSGNKIIHGDNLEALKSLLPEYEGKIKCIYIDPPYNTGEEKWVYNDNVNDPKIKKWLGEVVGKQGEDLSRHDKWLCMMYPRLKLLQKLLHNNGAIFISIDRNEFSNLKLLCDEIFGSNNFVANISWQRTYSPRNDKKGISDECEYILVYSKSIGWIPKKLERDEKMNSVYKNPDNDYSLWRTSDAFAPSAATHQGMVYAIQHPITGELIYPYNGACWPLQQSDMLKEMMKWANYKLEDIQDDERRANVCGVSINTIRKGVKAIILDEPLELAKSKSLKIYGSKPLPKFFFTKNGYGGIARKTYLDNAEGRVVTNLWHWQDVGHTDEAKKELKAVFNGESPFNTPKPTRLIERILNIATDDNDIVLDSFAGSGTTASAVLRINNKEKDSCRRFILIELLNYAETITAQRVKNIMTGYSFVGKKEEILFSKKLTIKNVANANDIISEANKITVDQSKVYSKISKPKIEDNCVKVIGTKEYKGLMDGTGGAFDYYELGQPIFKKDKNLNEEVGESKIREYIYYTETKQYLERVQEETSKYLLDTYNDTGYYFYYEKDNLTTLTIDTLSIVTEKADQYIIYADKCMLDKEYMQQKNIVFKKIPRDIKRF